MNLKRHALSANEQAAASCGDGNEAADPQRSPPRSLVQEEKWRRPTLSCEVRRAMDDSVVASRWTRQTAADIELSSQSGFDQHTIGINLKSTTMVFHSGSTIFEGQVSPGATQVTGPGQTANAVFRAACDVIHLYIPQQVLVRHYEEALGRPHAGDIVIGSPEIVRDPTLERLGRALADMQSADAAFASLYVDSVCLAIVARLLERHFTKRPAIAPERDTPLPLWRLRRAFDYIEAHLSEPIRLMDIASSVGLSRMHFAAQFRSATGYAPHAYLLQRRVEHAKALLRHSEKSILDIAVDSGFQSQSHFTTAFRRLVGDTPKRWRIRSRLD